MSKPVTEAAVVSSNVGIHCVLTQSALGSAANNTDHPLAVSRDGSRIFWPQAVEQPRSDVSKSDPVA
jgi:hypothetical protein